MILLPHSSTLVSVSRPRASGDDPRVIPSASVSRSVDPARAGMIPSDLYSAIESDRRPRASGDDPTDVLKRIELLL